MRQPADISSTGSQQRVNPVIRLFATGLFTGYSPVASGTAGSLLALFVLFIPVPDQPWLFVVLIGVTFVAGIAASARMEHAIGEDPSIVVIDEIVGMWIAIFLVPATIPAVMTAFLLFRIFDILKPPPARQAERYRKGVGIMLDDVVAGIYANLATQSLILLFPAFFGLAH